MSQTRNTEKIRYAVVGGGWIAQAAFIPGVAHTGNSKFTALITGDAEKARTLGYRYNVRTWSYKDYADALASGEFDAVYIALPNEMHRDYAVPALDAGIHVLLEKPMATTEDDCHAIIDAAKRSGAKLMIGYRLHFEPATLEALQIVRSGRIGKPRLFTSAFTQQVAASNHRAYNGFWAGPVADMGPYPINAARMLFGAEPLTVWAAGAMDMEMPYNFHHSVAVVLRFPGDQLAQFSVSYTANPVDQYRIIGDAGDLEVSPSYMFGVGLKHRLTIGSETTERGFEITDQFGGELRYFSDCILRDQNPQPDGAEGLADVRVLAAIEQSLLDGKLQQLDPARPHRAPQADAVQVLPAIKPPKLVGAAAPGDA